MIDKILGSPVVLSLIAAILYGFGGPVMKYAGLAGATPNGLALMYGVGLIIMSFNLGGKATFFTTPTGAVLGLLVGLMFGLAFRAIARAFTLPTGYVSVVLLITAAYPVISCLYGLLFMGESQHVLLGRLIIGTGLVVSGVYCVSTSIK